MAYNNFNFKTNDLLQYILVLWHSRKYEKLSNDIFCDVKTIYTFFLIKRILLFDYCEHFDEGIPQEDSKDDSQGHA